MMSLESVLRLGWSYAKVLGVKLVGLRPQLPLFVAQYERDGIVLFEASDDAVVAGASRCIACGRCDTAALLGGRFELLGSRGPMAFVLGVARHTGQHDEAEVSPAATVEALAALTAECPVAVPFVGLASLVRRRQRALGLVRGNAVAGALEGEPSEALDATHA